MKHVRLLIATTNPGKFKETAFVLRESGLKILGLNDFPDIRTVLESGTTFEENAILKAKGYFEQTKTPTIADDGGLAVDYLNGAPGVNSHRWLGYEASAEELARAIIEKMRSVPREKRIARLGGFMVFWDGVHLLKQENWIEGYIAEEIVGKIEPGLPYRPLLILEKFNKPYGNLTAKEHEKVNFRIKNLKALKPAILEHLMTR